MLQKFIECYLLYFFEVVTERKIYKDVCLRLFKMETVEDTIGELFEQFEVKKQMPEFLDRARFLEERFCRESLRFKHVRMDENRSFSVLDVMSVYCEDEETPVLTLSSNGMLWYTNSFFEGYNGGGIDS